MAVWLLALLLALGTGTWTWNKTMKETSRQDTSLILGGVVGLMVFVVIVTLFSFVLQLD